jgi:hypothetical protein
VCWRCVRQASAASYIRQEFSALLREVPGPTADDVPITINGDRLETKEKALAFCADLEVARGVALELMLQRFCSG